MLHNNIEKPKAIGIARRSDKKKKNNASLQTQKEHIISMSNAEGYQIINIFEDDGVSAYHKSVNQRQAMIKAKELILSDGEDIQALFFYDESRMTRQFFDFTLSFVNPIKAAKPHFKFFSTQTNSEWSPMDINAVLNQATAARESVIKSARSIDGQDNSIKSRKRPGSEVPFGYKPVRNPIDDTRTSSSQIIDEEQAPIVLFIFYLASWGHSQQKIASLLNEVGIPSPSDKSWTSGTIDYILNNDQYLGHLPWNIRTHLNKKRKKERGEYDLINQHHDAIISAQFCNITHQTIELHKKYGKNNETPFLLRGLLVCEHCEEQLNAKNQSTKNKQYLIYQCPLCKNKLKAGVIHEVILQELSSKWNEVILSMNQIIPSIIKDRKKTILQHRDKLKSDLQKVEYKQGLLNNKGIKNDSGIWDFALSVSKSTLKQEIYKANQFLEHLNIVEDTSATNQLHKLLSIYNLDKLAPVEIRTVFLTLFKMIKIDFKNNQHIYVEYQLAPYAELDEYYSILINNDKNA